MTWVLRLGHGVEHHPDGRGGTGADALSERTRAELAEWHALAPATRGPARDVLAQRADELADRVHAETGEPVHVVPDGPEPTPWGTGLTLALGSGVLVVVATGALYGVLAGLSVVLGVVVVTVVLVGLAPAALRRRAAPVWRWVVLGALVGAALGWLGVLAAALA